MCCLVFFYLIPDLISALSWFCRGFTVQLRFWCMWKWTVEMFDIFLWDLKDSFFFLPSAWLTVQSVAEMILTGCCSAFTGALEMPLFFCSGMKWKCCVRREKKNHGFHSLVVCVYFFVMSGWKCLELPLYEVVSLNFLSTDHTCLKHRFIITFNFIWCFLTEIIISLIFILVFLFLGWQACFNL